MIYEHTWQQYTNSRDSNWCDAKDYAKGAQTPDLNESTSNNSQKAVLQT